MSQAQDYGMMAEQYAAEYLTAQGYVIRERNWSPRAGHVEIDIVAQQGNLFVFVEVKARIDGFRDATEAVDRRKIAHLTRAANAFIRMLPPEERDLAEARFDIIAINGLPPAWRLEHMEDAFLPPFA